MEQQSPLTEPVVRFGDSNPLVLALLGLVHRAEQIDACLPMTAHRLDGPDGSASPHDLDLALLGLVALGRRFGELAPQRNLDPRQPEADQDLLR